MYVLETLKKTFERATGLGKPSAASMRRFGSSPQGACRQV